MHNLNSGAESCLTVNDYFGFVYKNFSKKHEGLICALTRSVCELECVNIAVKRKYFEKLLQHFVEQNKGEEAYNTILAFRNTEERKEFYSELIKQLSKSKKLDQLQGLFSDHFELSIVSLLSR